jgi:cytochrome c oxidase assembly protein subunit 20
MAADTRKEPDPRPTDSSKTYASFTPLENANTLQGASLSTAGGRTPNVGIAEIAKSITLEDLQTVHTKPCVRDSLLMGILGGFGIGGVRAILGGKKSRLLAIER